MVFYRILKTKGPLVKKRELMTDRRPTLLILLVILSLVFHGCFLIFFLFIERPQEHTPPSISFESFDDPNDPQNNNQFSSGLAALKPRASSFGTPVSLQNEPPPSPQQASVQDEKGDDQENQPSTDTQNSEGQEKEPIHNEKAHIDAPPAMFPSLEAATPHENSQETKSQAGESPAPQPRKKRRKKKRRSSSNSHNSITGMGMPTRQLNFADIAQGFIESLKHEGDDWLKRDGDPNKRPDEGELRYLSYIQKVVWYLQNSFRQTEPKHWPTAAASVSFKITLNKEGEIHDLRCLQSCGNEKIDSYLRKRIAQAGPFPPLPDHFKRNDFQILLSFSIGSQRMPQINGYIATIAPR